MQNASSTEPAPAEPAPFRSSSRLTATRQPFESANIMNNIVRNTLTLAATAVLATNAFAGGNGNKARTDVETKETVIANIASGRDSTASTSAGLIEQKDQSQSEASTRVRLERTAIINVATGRGSKATTDLGSIKQH